MTPSSILKRSRCSGSHENKGKVKKSLRFGSDVKKNDGLRASSKVYEDIMITFCHYRSTITAKKMLIHMERMGVLDEFDTIRALCLDGIARLKENLQKKDKMDHVPILKTGGGVGFGLMPEDTDVLHVLVQRLGRASDLLDEYRTTMAAMENSEKDMSSPVSVLPTQGRGPMSPIEL